MNLIPSHTLNNIFAVFPPVKNKLLCKDLIYKGILNSSQDDLFFINSGLYRLAPVTKFPEQKEKINIILHYGVINIILHYWCDQHHITLLV